MVKLNSPRGMLVKINSSASMAGSTVDLIRSLTQLKGNGLRKYFSLTVPQEKEN
jgi:hypothetical protein